MLGSLKHAVSDIFTAAFLFILIFKTACAGQSESPADSLNRIFFNQLKELAGDESPAAISTLGSFVVLHPDYWAGCNALLLKYVAAGRVQEANVFFRELGDHPPARRAVARLHILNGDSAAAFAVYQALAQTPNLPVPILQELISFAGRYLGEGKLSGFIHQLLDFHENGKVVAGLAAYQRRDYSKALKEFQGLPESNEQYFYEALCFYRLRQYARADSLWKKSAEQFSRQNDLARVSDCHLYRGFAAFNRDDSLALACLDTALSIAKQIGDYQRQQRILGNCASLNYNQYRYDRAFRDYNDAISAARRAPDRYLLAKWYAGLGEAAFYLDKFVEALTAYEAGEKAAASTGNRRLLVSTWQKKGDLYFYLHQNELAEKAFRDALQLAQAAGFSASEEKLKLRLADLDVSRGKFDAGRRVYLDYVKTARDWLNKTYWLRKIADTYNEEGDNARALRYYRKSYQAAQASGYRNYIGWTQVYLAGSTTKSGRPGEALKIYREVLPLAEEEGDSSMLAAAFVGMGDAFRAGGDSRRAVNFYLQAARLIESTRQQLNAEQMRIGYFSEAQSVYEKLISSSLPPAGTEPEPARLDSLFWFLEMRKARTLYDLRAAGGSIPEPSPDYLQASLMLRRLQRRLRSQWRPDLSQETLDKLLGQLQAARYALISQRLKMLAGASAPGIDPQTMQQLREQCARRGDALLNYHISEDTSLVMVATGGKLHLVPLNLKPGLLNILVDSLVGPFHRVTPASLAHLPYRAEVAFQLYQLLIRPVEEKVKLPGRLVIVPDRSLFNLPFEMLQTQRPYREEYVPNDEPVYATDFLLNRYGLMYSPGTFYYLMETTPLPERPKILVVANPFSRYTAPGTLLDQLRSRNGWQFLPLPFADLEAESIRTVYPRADIYRHSFATKSVFFREAGRQDILHLATHGFIDRTFDAFSGLVFAPSADSTDDGLLMGYEISGLKLNCNLITLSACETGQGRLVAGEGVMGLPRLFLRAGAQSVLLTHWKVDDRFSSRLMPDFYDLLLNGRLSKADALTRVRRELLKKPFVTGQPAQQHPFYWAAFTLFGDPGSTERTPARTFPLYWYLAFMILFGLYLIFRFRFARQRGNNFLPD